MPRKPMTEEQKNAARERLAKARAARKSNTNTEPQEVINPPETPQAKEDVTISHDDFQSLMQRLKQLESAQFQPQAVTPQLNAQGAVVGTREKHVVNPNHYPDFTERLADEPRLQRFAFKDNYELVYKVDTVRYQTIDGIWQKEPQFSLTLLQVAFDEETGEATQGRYVLRRGVFFEDPEAAIAVALENGLEVDENTSKSFLDEMRYLRMKNWLMDVFYPPRSTAVQNRKEMVIDGTVVEYFEINSENAQTMPFDKLSGTKKL